MVNFPVDSDDHFEYNLPIGNEEGVTFLGYTIPEYLTDFIYSYKEERNYNYGN